MNRPIRRVAVLVMVLFAMLLANGTYLVVFRQPSLNADPTNRRAREAEFDQNRGPILAGNVPIAYSEPSGDRFKYQRVYPRPRQYAPITGYFSYDHAGDGLEASYNTELAGTADSLFVRRMIDRITNQQPQGATIQTTIDPQVQKAAYQALNDRKGAAVAIDPKTGAVLALASTPSYDPNLIADHDIEAADDAYRRLINDEDNPMANRAAREIYPPGSTFKLVTAAAALESGITPDTKVPSPKKLTPAGGRPIYNENRSSCGGKEITLTQALEVSCNTAFAGLGIRLGQEPLREQAEAFGFNSRHLSALAGAASVFPEDELGEALLAQCAIGQFEVAASPLQMAMVTAAIANDGALMDPYLVSEVRSNDLQVLSRTDPDELSQPMSPETAAQLKQMMVSVVENGTGTAAQIPGIDVGGKTGTAQWDPDRKPYAWFTALAPASDPQIAVAVMIADADIPREEIAGGALAAPIARAMIEARLQR